MDRAARVHIYLRTLHHMRNLQYDYAILEDAAHPDNYVQFGPYHPDVTTHFEVTSRMYPDQSLPPLSSGQVDALVALGLSRVPSPNHEIDIAYGPPEQIAELCEMSFAVLGSAADFDVIVADVGFWKSNPVWKERSHRL